MKIEIYENVGKTTANLLLREKGFTKDHEKDNIFHKEGHIYKFMKMVHDNSYVEFIELKEVSKN